MLRISFLDVCFLAAAANLGSLAEAGSWSQQCKIWCSCMCAAVCAMCAEQLCPSVRFMAWEGVASESRTVRQPEEHTHRAEQIASDMCCADLSH